MVKRILCCHIPNVMWRKRRVLQRMYDGAMVMSCRAVTMSLWRRDVSFTGDVTAASNLFKEAAKRLSIR